MERGCTHQAIAGAEGSQPRLPRPAPHLPDHMARVVGAGLDLGAGDAPETPLDDKARGQEVPVEAQVEFQGLPSVLQLVEGGELAPGGRRPPVKGPVGQVVGQEGSALVDLDGMDDVAAGARLWGEGAQCLPARLFTFPLTPLPPAGLPLRRQGTRTAAGCARWDGTEQGQQGLRLLPSGPALGFAGDSVKLRVRGRRGQGEPGSSGALPCPAPAGPA